MAVAKRIIPCLDVDKGRVVKGVNFLNIRDAGDPVEIAKRYDKEGADEITMLDITASHETRETTYKTVESIASQVFIPLTVGGGVRSIDDIKRLLRSGADKVSINTSAVENPDFVKEAADKFGSQCIVVAVDAKASSQSEDFWVAIIGLGIMALISMTTATSSLEANVTQQFSSLGTDVFTFRQRTETGVNRGQRVKAGAPITYDEAQRFAKLYPHSSAQQIMFLSFMDLWSLQIGDVTLK